LWPLAILLLWRVPLQRRILAISAFAVSAMIWRWIVVLYFDDWIHAYYRFDTRLSGLLLGCVAGIWRPRVPVSLGWFGLLAIVSAFHLASWRDSPGVIIWTLVAEGGAVLLVLGAHHLAPLGHPIVVWLGRMSYGIYLW